MGPDQAFHRAPSTFDAKVDAEAWLAAERRLMQNDEWSPSKSRRAKVVRSTEMFGPYAEAWLEQGELKPRTQALYRRLLDRFVLPAFGEVSLRDITPQVVRAWHSGLDASRPTQRAHTHSLLRSILSTAVTDEILASNPCRVRGAGSAKRVRSIEPATPWRARGPAGKDPCAIPRPRAHRRMVRPEVREVSELRRRTLTSRPGPSTSSRSRPRRQVRSPSANRRTSRGSGTSRCLHTCCRSSSSTSRACRARSRSAALPVRQRSRCAGAHEHAAATLV